MGAIATSISRLRMNRSLSIDLEVHRIDDGDDESSRWQLERNDDVFAGDRLGHHFDDRMGNLDFGEVDELVSVRLRFGLPDLRFADVVQPDERLLRRDAHAGGHFFRFGELVGTDRAVLYELLKPVLHRRRSSVGQIQTFSRREQRIAGGEPTSGGQGGSPQSTADRDLDKASRIQDFRRRTSRGQTPEVRKDGRSDRSDDLGPPLVVSDVWRLASDLFKRNTAVAGTLPGHGRRVWNSVNSV